MERHAAALQIDPGRKDEFRAGLKTIWPEVTKLCDSLSVSNLSIWEIRDLVFIYYETEKSLSPAQEALWKACEAQMGNCFHWLSSPLQEMRLMYHDFGIVRECKEQIRHRVFVTQLKGDFQEEYKRRHDALVEQRGDTVDPGPDSNFSIWNTGRYIFGYDEIDVTMEKEPTEADRAATIAWETRMLEIMDWYTDDVDWITGERHEHILRLGYHN